MEATPDAYDPARLEESTRQFWKARGLPAPSGTIGPATGPLIHQIIGTIASDANPIALAQGGVLADVDARFFALTGRRSIGRLLVRPSRAETPHPRTAELLADAGAWAAGVGTPLRDPELDAERIQRMVERLAVMGILIRRETPLRSCPRCRVPRTLAGIIYHEEEGPAYLVRFPLAGATPGVSLIVWTDAAWKLLGAPAVLADPSGRYVTVRYRRKGGEERILVARSSLPRLMAWLPGGEWEILDEVAGRDLDGRRYEHPLGTESPMLANPPAPSGQIHGSEEVTDTGTGFVALVPAHGAADAAASRALDLPGWPVLDADLSLTGSFRHKYQGLPVEAGEAFVLRDLREGGYLFAELTVRRGVPRCAVCRTPLVWETGSAWCLEPASLPAARLDLFAGLIPGERAPPSTEVVPWPVSAREPDPDPLTPQLRECGRCHRLAAPEAPATCPCGGESAPQRRRLLPVFREALLAWADESPFPSGESARLYLPARRRVPTLVHHLVAMEAADAHPGEVRASFLTTLPSDESLAEWLASSPRDAARAAFVSLTDTPRGGTAALVERRAQHALRLRRFWTLAQRVTDTARTDRSLGAIAPVASRTAELLDEDRALLSRFERLRRDVTGRYEAGDAAGALRLLEQFFDGPLRTLYLPAATRRLDSQVATERGPVVALLAHILTTWSELYGPVAPFTAEAVSRLFVGDGRSLFERKLTPILDSALDPAVEGRAESWWAIVEATRRARRHLGLEESVPLPQIVLGARDEAHAVELRAAAATIGRLAHVTKVDVASPQLPWTGRQLQITAVMPAIQKVFGAGAPRVARILQGLAPARVRDGIRSKTLEVAVEGRPVQISQAMVDIVERLPEGFLTFPWSGGELIVQAPAAGRSSGESRRVVSSDAYRVLRRVRQRIRTSARPEGVRVVVVCATGALSDELVRLAPSLAGLLGVPLFRVVATTDGFPLSETTTGRTGRGVAWSIWVPGSRRPEARLKQRAARAHQQRVRRAARRDPIHEAVAEIQSDPAVRRDAEIDRWIPKIDALVGRPLVGPSKLRAAWEAGIQQYEDLVHAPFEQLTAVPGFGPFVAGELLARAGGEVPPRASLRPLRRREGGFAADPPPSRASLLAESPPAAPLPLEPASLGPSLPSRPAEPSPLVRTSVGGTTLLVPSSTAPSPSESPVQEEEPASTVGSIPPGPPVGEPPSTPPEPEGGPTAAPIPSTAPSDLLDGAPEPVPASDPPRPAAEPASAPIEVGSAGSGVTAGPLVESTDRPSDAETAAAESPPPPLGADADTGPESVVVAASPELPSSSLQAPSVPSATMDPPDVPPPLEPIRSDPPSVASAEIVDAESPPGAESEELPAREPAELTSPPAGSEGPPAGSDEKSPVSSPADVGKEEAPSIELPELPSVPEVAPAPGPEGIPPSKNGPEADPALSVPLEGSTAPIEPPPTSTSESPPAFDRSPASDPDASLSAPDPAQPALEEPTPTDAGAVLAAPPDLVVPPSPPSETPDSGESSAPDPDVIGGNVPPAEIEGSTAAPDEPPTPVPTVESPADGPIAENLSAPGADPVPPLEPEAGVPPSNLEIAPPAVEGAPLLAASDLRSEGEASDETPPEAGNVVRGDVASIPPGSGFAREGEQRIPVESTPPISIVETAEPVGTLPAPSPTSPEIPASDDTHRTSPVPEPPPIENAPSAPLDPVGRPPLAPISPAPADEPSAAPEPSEPPTPPEWTPDPAESVPPPPAPTTDLSPTAAPLEPTSPAPFPPPTAVPAERIATVPVAQSTSSPEAAAPTPPPMPTEPTPEPPMAPEVRPSGLAVSSAAFANDAWPIFLDATAAGHRGLCVSREFPDRMRALLGPRDVTVVWLSNSNRPGSVRPSDLEALARLVEAAMATQQVRAVYLDHVEYLARVNPVGAVRSCLERIDAVARAHEARVWVALNPQLVTAETGAALAEGFPSAH